jgi:hypothetical protein
MLDHMVALLPLQSLVNAVTRSRRAIASYSAVVCIRMFPADLSIFVISEPLTLDPQELCLQSFEHQGNGGPVVVRFVDNTTLSPQAASYRPIITSVLPELACKASLWTRTDPNDRVMVVSSLDKALDACVHFLQENPNLDCRIVTVVTAEELARHLPDACRLAFGHMPVYGEENVRRTVDYALSLVRDLLSGKSPAKAIKRSVSVISAASGVDDNASRWTLRSRGAPIRFSTPFVSAGFNLNSRIVRENADGAYVSNSTKGTALYGPYLPIEAGRYQAVVQLRGDLETNNILNLVRSRPAGAIAFDAYLSATDSVLEVIRAEAVMLGPDPIQLELSFKVPELPERPKLELRLHQQSNKAFTVDFIELTWLEG